MQDGVQRCYSSSQHPRAQPRALHSAHLAGSGRDMPENRPVCEFVYTQISKCV